MNQREFDKSLRAYEDSNAKFDIALENFINYLEEEIKNLKEVSRDFEGYDFSDNFREILNNVI